jgi:alpha-methylacyl-CoA racemase
LQAARRLNAIELSGIGPGTRLAMLLADLGAEVVRIDQPGAGVSTPVVERARHRLALDLMSVDGKALCRQAASKADVLIEGFRPKVMERLGIGPEEPLALNPGLIYAPMTGWGQDRPLAQDAGHDINEIAITGALPRWARRARPPPRRRTALAISAAGGCIAPSASSPRSKNASGRARGRWSMPQLSTGRPA